MRRGWSQSGCRVCPSSAVSLWSNRSTQICDGEQLSELNKLWFSESGNSNQPHQPTSLLFMFSMKGACWQHILVIQTIFSSILCVIRLQQRCNLDSHRMMRTHLFHRICKLARPVDTPLCRMSLLFLHLQRFLTEAK